MNRLDQGIVITARIGMSIVFLLNGFGIIDQTLPATELVAAGAPAGFVPLMMLAGRTLQIFAGLALAFGVYPQFAALALASFLIPATLTAHAFWLAVGAPAFTGQLINFCKNLTMFAGLMFVAGASTQPSLLPGTRRLTR